MYFSYPSYQFLRYICVTQCDGVSNLQGLSCHTVVYVLCEWQVLVQKFTVMLHVWCAFLHSWLTSFSASFIAGLFISYLRECFMCQISILGSWSYSAVWQIVSTFHCAHGSFDGTISSFQCNSCILHFLSLFNTCKPPPPPPTPKCFIAVLPISVQWWTFNMICHLWTTEYLNECIMLFLAIPCAMHASFSICPWQLTMYT